MINPTAWKEDMLAIAGVLSFIVVAPETYDRTTATLPIQPNKNSTLTRFLRSPWAIRPISFVRYKKRNPFNTP